jgi:hypothetical protein
MRLGLEALDRLIQFDRRIVPQDHWRSEYFGQLKARLRSDHPNTRNIADEEYHLLNGQMQTFLTSLYQGLMSTTGSRKFALVLSSYPQQHLQWQVDKRLVPIYNPFTQKAMQEVLSMDLWWSKSIYEDLNHLLASERTDSQILQFKMLF